VAWFKILTCIRSKFRTRDMGGQSTTHEFTKAILDKMETV
jgi:isocitrate/isopropylmalate dehydrogenase